MSSAKTQKTSSMTAQYGPSMARNALLQSQALHRFKFVSSLRPCYAGPQAIDKDNKTQASFCFLQLQDSFIAAEAERISGPFGAWTRQPSLHGGINGVSVFRSASAALSLI